MQTDIEKSIAVLERTPEVLRTMLAGLPEEWVERNEGGETWSPYTVIGHLVHGERADWIPRARIILDEGESRPFDPVDRFAQFRESEGKSLEDLLDELATLRAENVRTLREIVSEPADLERKGMHPDLGQVTLGELIATWVAHDLDHIVQVARTMAYQYRDAVGPWRAYLSVVRAAR